MVKSFTLPTPSHPPQLRFISFAVVSLWKDLHLQDCAMLGARKKDPAAHATASLDPALDVTPFAPSKTLTERHQCLRGAFAGNMGV
jgi:hypothetical protein